MGLKHRRRERKVERLHSNKYEGTGTSGESRKNVRALAPRADYFLGIYLVGGL